MNIFFLHNDPAIATLGMCNKHVVKMIVESAQMLSTAHRMLDGYASTYTTKSGIRKYHALPDARESILYRDTHANHPCSLWARATDSNYIWLYTHMESLCELYTEYYGKIHASSKLPLSILPTNIPVGELTTFPMAMPDEFRIGSPVESYREYYTTKLFTIQDEMRYTAFRRLYDTTV